MSKYKITLTPVDKFFFGGDMTFQIGTDEKDSINRQYSSYIIQSNYIPQQTSLLGMLRFLILRNAGKDVFENNTIQDFQESGNLIGPRSFSVGGINDFGCISCISHVRILRVQDGTELEVAPLFGDIGSQTVEGNYNGRTITVPDLTRDQYNAKDGLTCYLTDGQTLYKFEEQDKNGDAGIFVEDRRIGIARSVKTGKTDDGALFKQVSYRFNNTRWGELRFLFEAEVEDLPNEKKLTEYNGQMVSIGADNSQFIIGITAVGENQQASSTDGSDDASAVSDNGSLCLLSPAFLSKKEVTENTCFAITRLVPFRFLTDRTAEDGYNPKSYHILNGRLKRSERYDLYAAGSVFYFKDAAQKQSFIEKLTAKKDFRQIGYNEYK